MTHPLNPPFGNGPVAASNHREAPSLPDQPGRGGTQDIPRLVTAFATDSGFFQGLLGEMG